MRNDLKYKQTQYNELLDQLDYLDKDIMFTEEYIGQKQRELNDKIYHRQKLCEQMKAIDGERTAYFISKKNLNGKQ